MSVEFEEEKNNTQFFSQQKSSSIFSPQFLVSQGLASNTTQGAYALLALSICALVLGAYLVFSSMRTEEAKVVAPEGSYVITEKNTPPRLNKPVYITN